MNFFLVGTLEATKKKQHDVKLYPTSVYSTNIRLTNIVIMNNRYGVLCAIEMLFLKIHFQKYSNHK